MIITLSGPPASGKGTLARMLAKHLGLPHYDFGLMYRALAFSNLQVQLLRFENGRVMFENADVTETLRTEEVGILAAKIAHLLKDYAVSLVRHTDFVCDGRTCGTEIYPNADIKFYITANQKERIERRFQDGGNREIMSQREAMDELRLVIPVNAIVVDTTGKTAEESLEEILSNV